MKIKSSIAAAIAVTLLAGCASERMIVRDGVKQQQFAHVTGYYLPTKEGLTIAVFEPAIKDCWDQSLVYSRSFPDYFEALIPFNYAAKIRNSKRQFEKLDQCIEAQGFKREPT